MRLALKESPTVSPGMTDSEVVSNETKVEAISSFTVTWDHVPSDPSKERVLWAAHLSHRGTPVGEFEYSQGVGLHGVTPHFHKCSTAEREKRVALICEGGKRLQRMRPFSRPIDRPTLADILGALAGDAQCRLDSASLETFAEEFGYTKQGYAGARAADKAWEECTRARDMFVQCGYNADAIHELMERD